MTATAQEDTMLVSKIRSAVVVGAVSVGLVALAAPAHAVTVKGSTTDILAHITKPKKDVELRIRSSDERLVVLLIDAGELVAYTQAGATGQGETQEQCDDRAASINAWNNLAEAAFNHEMWDEAGSATINAVLETEEALDAGCFIVYKQGPPPEPEPEIG